MSGEIYITAVVSFEDRKFRMFIECSVLDYFSELLLPVSHGRIDIVSEVAVVNHSFYLYPATYWKFDHCR